LPAGVWYDWWTGETFAGKRWIERPVDLTTLPLYARAGSIIPLDPVRQYTAQSVTEPTILVVFSGANSAFTLYDDDGQSLAYRGGSDSKAVWIRLQWDQSARRLTIEADSRMKKWPGSARTFRVEVPGGNAPPKQVEFRGEKISVSL